MTLKRLSLASALVAISCLLITPLFAAADDLEAERVINVVSEITGAAAPLVESSRSLLDALMAEAGLEYEFESAPWLRLVSTLERQPNTLAYSVSRTPEREDEYFWIGKIRSMHFQLYGLTERLHELPQTLSDAQDYRIAVLRGDMVDEFLQSQNFSNLMHPATGASWLELLLRERFDLVPYSEQLMQQQLQMSGFPGSRFTPVIDLGFLTDGLYMVMNKTSDPELVDLLQTSFQNLIDNGEFDRIMSGR